MVRYSSGVDDMKRFFVIFVLVFVIASFAGVPAPWASGKCPRCGKVWNQPWAKSFKTCPDDGAVLIEIESRPSSEKSEIVRAITIKKVNKQFSNYYRRRVAFCIGINNYPNFPTLEFAVKDAQDMAGVFQGFGFDEVYLLTDGRATKPRIVNELLRFKAESAKNDLFVFYFAGHGTTAKNSRGRENGYLLTVDTTGDSIHETGVSMGLFKDICDTMPGKHILFLADCCYSGYGLTRSITVKRKPAKNEAINQYLKTITSTRAVQLLSAGGKNDLAHERNGHGIFTSFLLDVLKGKTSHKDDGVISVLEMASYIKQKVIKDTKGRQNPGFGYLSGNGDVVFITGQQKRPVFKLDDLLSLEEIETIYNEAESLWEKGEFNKAEKKLTSAYADFRKHHSKDKKKNFRYLKVLANLSLKMEKNDMGAYYSQAIINESADELDISFGYSQLGIAWHRKGEYNTAAGYFQRALEIDLKILGKNHPDIAKDYNNLGGISKSKGDFDKAILYFEKALEIVRLQFGEETHGAAVYYNNLGFAHNSRGDYDKALLYYQKSLKIDLLKYGENHPEIAIRYNGLGLCHYYKGEHETAIEYFNKALKIDMKKLGKNHSNVAKDYNYLGLVYNIRGEHDKAIEYYKKALKIDLKIKGEDHPGIAVYYNNLSGAFGSKGELDRAVEYYQKALKINMKKLGEAHPEVAKCYINIGAIYNSKGEHNLALESFQNALEIQKLTLEPDHPETAASYWWIGILYQKTGKDDDKAKQYLKNAHAIYVKRLGTDHPTTRSVKEYLDWYKLP